MARIGYGYGSECHLLRWMGRHRKQLEDNIIDVMGRRDTSIEFLDFHFKPGQAWPDAELRGVEFIPADYTARSAWKTYWPQTGNVPNWDAVGKITGSGGEEWLLVEAKAHIEELESRCGARENGGLPLIREAFQTTMKRLGIRANVSAWLEPYYQYANRLAVLSFLHSCNIPANLLNIYFIGDISRKGLTSPQTAKEWEPHIAHLESHLGISAEHKLTPFVHNLFLSVASEQS